MQWFSLLMILNSFLLSSGCWMPRREAMVKRCFGALFSGALLVVDPSPLLERTE